MEPTELDTALEELEIRLERLRALYQQYFLGIEKLEPTVARKDVDRRIWALRKSQIRNTMKRFKLNVIVQRYNTFQQYWARTCREIENGTYRRHVLRAERTIGGTDALTIAARKRMGIKAPEEREEAQAKAEEAARQLEQEFDQALEAGLDPIDELKRAMDEALGASVPPGSDSSEQPEAAPIPPAPAVPEAGTKLSPLDLEFDDVPRKSKPPQPVARPPRPASGRPPRRVARPARPVPSPAPAQPQRSDETTPVQPETASGRPVQPQGKPPPASGRPLPPGARPLAPSGRPLPAPRARLSQAKRPGEPAPAKPAAPPAPSPRPGPEGAGTGLSEQRIKQLHVKLVDAKRRTNDPSKVSEQGLAKSLKAAEEKLRKQHGSHRRVDFDVVIKNGKAVVKPIVR